MKQLDKYVSHRGLTLIELVLVLAIVGILAMIAIPSYTKYMEKAKIVTSIGDIMMLEQDITRYMIVRNGDFPNSLADIGINSLKDPWGRPYQYLNHANVKGQGKSKGQLRKDKNLVPINSDFDLYSMGKDGRSLSPLTAKHSRDDIVRANNGGYIGLASEY